MKTIIAEKPSVAKAIAILLGATEKKEGYLVGNGYFVTWAFGHLVKLGTPEDYGISGFNRNILPILPDPFLLTIRTVVKNQNSVIDPAAYRQLKVIKELFNKSESLIVATDSGREGELIFRYIYKYLNCTKPFKRLWISSLTNKAILQGFKSLREGKEFDGLYLAAQSRSRADWLVGINATQALTIASGGEMYSLGRVQTPTLALICERYLDHKNFSIAKYWQLRLTHNKNFTDFKSISKSKWDNEESVETALRSIRRNGKARVVSVECKGVTESPPLLFNLTSLQKEANEKLNFSAEETLHIAQNLYEKKFITYPRTGSKYITDDIWCEIPYIVRALENKISFKDAISKIKKTGLNKRIVDNLRVTDHHGLLVTEKIPSALSPKENAIYDMIALRLLESIAQNCIKCVTIIDLEILHYEFRTKGCTIIEPGWRAVKGLFSEEHTEFSENLPSMKKGDELEIKEALIVEKQTKPPLLYTEAGLLSAMENAGRKLEKEEERKILHDIGIGTPATRASIIETLLTRNYIQRDKKTLIPTEKGMQLYELVKSLKIANVAMTAEWELTLKKIETGTSDSVLFEKKIENYVKLITEELLHIPIFQNKYPKLVCPQCSNEYLVIRDKIVKCPDEECSWIQHRLICGVQISIDDIENLVTKKKTTLIKGMTSKKGKPFDAYLVLDHKFKTSFNFD